MIQPQIRSVQSWIIGLSVLLSAALNAHPANADPSDHATQIPSAAVACYFTGRTYLSVAPDGTGQGQLIEYFTNFNGIPGPLFNGPPSESTAFFTLRTNIFSFTPIRTNGDIALEEFDAGTSDIYYNPNPPNRSWGNPDQFSSGQLVARFARQKSVVWRMMQTDTTNPPPFESISHHPVTGTLLHSENFTFQGKKYNFNKLAPGGITHNEFISNTGVPGITGFPIGLAYAGHCLAVGTEEEHD
jgi:hypothetical protein